MKGWGKMRVIFRVFALAAAFLGLSQVSAFAADPQNYQLGLSTPVSPDAVDQIWFHNDLLLPIITIITIFVLILLVYTCWRFSEKRNPTPSKTTHNSLLEVAWTLIPVLILVAIAPFSLRLLYQSDDTSAAEMNIKIIGHQWYWSYEYPDHGDIAFDSLIMARTHEEAEEMGVKRLMDVDQPMVIPTGTEIRLLMTSGDVIHNWAVSEFGIRVDTVPGRLNEESFMVPEGKEGIYYGFCSELCGIDHAFMPIAVKAVSKEDFAKWVEKAKEEFASNDVVEPTYKVAGLLD